MSDKKVTAEFTIEPFTEGNPGSHVTSAILIAESSGLEVQVGPFGTTVSGKDESIFALVPDVLRAAMENGASRVSMQITKV